jgi:hypothetical protein
VIDNHTYSALIVEWVLMIKLRRKDWMKSRRRANERLMGLIYDSSMGTCTYRYRKRRDKKYALVLMVFIQLGQKPFYGLWVRNRK